MKMLLLMLLVGFSTLTTTTGEDIAVIEMPGSPVVIERATLGLNTSRGPTTVLVALQARSASGDVVDQFTARVDVIGEDGRARGFVARSQGPVYPESASYEVPLQGWATGKGDLRVTVMRARVGNRTWSDGVWTEDAEMEIPQGLACARDFCLSMSMACSYVTCKRAGCVLSFKCSMGPKSCDVECICRVNIICGGP
jgi:hypothetical protein